MNIFNRTEGPDRPLTMRNARKDGWEITNELYQSRDPDEELIIGKNTCGVNWITCFLGRVVQWFVGVNFDIACWFHDEEWSIENKSIRHKVDADGNLELNLIRCLTSISVNKLRLAAWFHGLVTINVTHYNED